MKLGYTASRVITTADLFDATDPPLVFTVRVRPSREWAQVQNRFEESGSKDEALARSLIALAFLTVTDGGEVYEIDTVEQVEALQSAIEDSNPGYGGQFVCDVAWAFSVNHYTYLGDRLGNSLKPLEPSSVNGQTKVKA